MMKAIKKFIKRLKIVKQNLPQRNEIAVTDSLSKKSYCIK